MKHLKLVFSAFVIFAFILSGCAYQTAGNSGKVPPGQAKKMTGSKSAKPFAPGQRKK
ncbi:hypothetical protein [Pedobacter glucosidilyticus]|uniref:hypothetical protein n=1 Tax=Pedobacter glucosidilyticus TaxID=1122941 RepID=UPI00040DFACC|nr:hypothetical protein [Pedobacter glucosidilyticus]